MPTKPPCSFAQFVPLTARTKPPFPAHVLSATGRCYVEAVAEATQTPGCMAGLLYLAILALCCAKNVVVQVYEGYREPVNLFVALIAEPGSRKSAVFKKMTEPVSDFEERERKQRGPEIEMSKQRQQILQDNLTECRGALKRRVKGDDLHVAEAELQEVVDEIARFKPIHEVKMWTSDCTTEQLGVIASEQGGRAAILAAEPSILGIMHGRYTTDGGPNIDFFLLGHAGDEARVDRRGRASLHIKSLALTLGIAMQPTVLRRMNSTPSFHGRGLLGRILYAYPNDLFGRRSFQSKPVPQSAAEGYARLVTDLLHLPSNRDDDGEIVPHVLELCVAGVAALGSFFDEIEPQLADGGDLEFLRNWSSKLVGAVARISGLLHMATHGSKEALKRQIDVHTVESAILIGRYLIPHAIAASHDMDENQELFLARRIVGWLKQHPRDHFSRADLYKSMRRGKRVASSEALDKPLDLLVTHGYVGRVASPASNQAGRPAGPEYEVNPAAAAFLKL